MSLLSKLFSKSAADSVAVFAPLSGRILPITEVPDDVFAGKMLGDGFAIEPTEGRVLAPFDCEVVQVFRTGHAIGLRGPGGLELLIHIGIDTVKMAGEGFSPKVSEGQKLKKGDLVLEFDLALVKSKAKSIITPVVITNMYAVKSLELVGSGAVRSGDPALNVSSNH